MKENFTQDLDYQAIKRTFNRTAKTYAEAAVLQNEVADRLLDRLDPIRINPAIIVDCGARTGYTTRHLKKKFTNAKVIALDLAEQHLRKTRKGLPWKRPPAICSRYETLALADNSVDFIFSNLTLHWCGNINLMLKEFSRVLKPNGLLLFSTLGPDTLQELRISFSQNINKTHIHSFTDMHDLGDLLLQSQLLDPVVDMEYLTMTYSSVDSLLADLKSTGSQNALQNRSRGLMGKKHWTETKEQYHKMKDASGLIPATFEIIYGHAWKPDHQKKLRQNADIEEVVIPINKITKIGLK